MALNVQAALADAREAYHDNADYVAAGSAAKCKAFITAARRLLVLLPSEAGNRVNNTRFQMDEIARQIGDAQEWLAASGSSSSSSSSSTSDGSITRGDLRRFRE